MLTLFSCSIESLTGSPTDNQEPTNPDTIDPGVGSFSYSIPDSLNFGTVGNQLSLSIKNNGKELINYTVSSSKNYIILASNSGAVSSLSQSDINVKADRTNLPAGRSYSKLYLDINNKKDTVVVSIDNFTEHKIILDTDVVDAEYSKITDQLVYVSANPSRVNIINTGSGKTETISLVYTPNCISVSQDGKTAAIGHDAHVTYVNLSNKSIINTYDVSCSAIDIVLGNNKWAYVFPERDQWTYIRSLNMNTAEGSESSESLSEIYAGTKGKLHPSGKFIYGADNGVSPSDVEKYNIQNGTLEYLYDSPYHGNYDMDGNLWFSEDGTRIFTRGKTVLKTSENRNQDMIYNGAINTKSNAKIEWLDHSSIKKNLYLVLSEGDSWTNKKTPFIYVYDSSNLNYKSKIDLEKYLVPNSNGGATYYNAEPYFAFSNSKGNTLFVLTKATGAGLDKEWAIEKISIE